MLKFLSCVLLVSPLFLTAKGRYVGDKCENDSAFGTCKTLSQCEPLLEEIREAGMPLPWRMRKKLQELSCGFSNNEPIVCCSTPNNVTPNNPNWTGVTFGMGVNVNENDQNNRFTWDDITKGPSTVRPQRTGSGVETTNLLNNRGDTVNDDNEHPPRIGNHRNLKLLPSNCGPIESDRIWGGNKTRLFEMPWMVLISYTNVRAVEVSCGGTLINEWYVLTAAHCVMFLGRKKLDKIILGEYDVTKDPDCERLEGDLMCAPAVRKVSIDKVIPHPGYTRQNLFDDIALVKLAQPADFTLDSMKPICLPTTTALQTENLTGQNAVVAGWGITENGLQSSVLLSVDLPVIANSDCQKVYNGSFRIYNRQMCAGGLQDKDSCAGDSGGPLMYPGKTNNGARYVQRGIVSFGTRRCAVEGFPAIYTRVAYYMDWILDNLQN